MESMFWAILRACVGPSNNDLQPKDALFFFAGCRMYVNYSNLMWLASPEKLARSAAPTDAVMARLLAHVERERYRTEKRPSRSEEDTSELQTLLRMSDAVI